MIGRRCAAGAALAATLAIAGASGCSKEGQGAARPCADDDRPRETSPAVVELLAAVPGDAAAIGFIDLPRPAWDLAIAGGPVPLEPAEKAALDQELGAHVRRHLGLDSARAQVAVGFLEPGRGRVALLVRPVAGEPKITGGERHRDTLVARIDDDVAIAVRGDVLLLGAPDAVRAAIDTMAGARRSVVTERPGLVEWLRRHGEGAVVAAAAMAVPGMSPPPPYAGLTRGAVALGERFVRVVVQGDDGALAALQAQASALFAAGLAEVERTRQAALTGGVDPVAGAGAILAAHLARSYAKRLTPVRRGDQLIAELSLDLSGGAGMTVPMVGVLAAVAVPAFVKYRDRARALQATPPPAGQPPP